MRNVFKKAAAVVIAGLLSVGGGTVSTELVPFNEYIIVSNALESTAVLEGNTLILKGKVILDDVQQFRKNSNVLHVYCEEGTILPNNCFQLFKEFTDTIDIDLSSANTTNVINMSYMFYNCNSLTSVDLSSFDTSLVTNMRYMFYKCSKIETLDLSSFNTSSLSETISMFESCTNLKTIYSSDYWDSSNITSGNSSYMFSSCSSIKGEKGTTYSSSNKNAKYARIDNAPSSPGYYTYKRAYKHVAAVPATYVSDGNKEYYIGSDGKYYIKDDDTYRVIEENSLVIPKLEFHPSMYVKTAGSKMDTYFTFPFSENTLDEYTVSFDGVEVNPVWNENKEAYEFRLQSAAKNMIDKHTLKVSKDGEKIWSNDDFSVANYLKTIIDKPAYSEFHEPAKAMLRYGAAAQYYFGYKTDTPANYGIDGYEIDSLENITVPESSFDGSVLNTYLDCSEYAGINMTFTADNSLMLAFRIKNGYSGDQVKSEIDALLKSDKIIVNSDIVREGYYSLDTDNTGKFIILKIDNIPIKKLGDPLLTIDQMSIKATDYLAKAQSDQNTNLQNLCKALYAFYEAATAQ